MNSSRRSRRFRLSFEGLETRCLPSVSYIVTDASDGAGSSSDVTLRYAITQAVAGAQTAVITFDSSLQGQTIAPATVTSQFNFSGSTAFAIKNSGTNITIDATSIGGITLQLTSVRLFELENGTALTLTDVTMTGNGVQTVSQGAAIASNGALTLNNCTIQDFKGVTGGAIFSNGSASSVTANNTTFSSDAATSTGGALELISGHATISNSTLSGNTATSHGGAIYNLFGTVSLSNDTIASNTAPDAALYSSGGTVHIDECTIADNTSGGLYLSTATVTVQNTIIAGDSSADITVSSATLSGSYNLIGDGSSLSSFTNSLQGSAGLDTNGLQNNGGPTKTIALLSTSQARNAGSVALIPNGTTTDQRGSARTYNNVVSMGAYQYFPAPPTASAGGPYQIVSGTGLTLNASGSASPDNLALTYTWDINGDGTFGDAVGVNPTLTWAQLNTLGITGPFTTSNLRVEVSDGVNTAVDSAATSLTVTARPPTASAGGPYAIVSGTGLTLNASGSASPDNLALTYTWDINGDGTFGDATGVNPTLTWAQLNALGITGPFTTSNLRVEVSDGVNSAVDSVATSLTVTQAPSTAGTFFLDAHNRIWRYEDGVGSAITAGYGIALSSGLDAQHNTELYFLDGNHQLWRYDQGVFTNTHAYATALVAGQAEVFFVDGNNQLWTYTDAGTFTNTHAYAFNLTLGHDAQGHDELWFVDGHNQLYRYDQGTFTATGAYASRLAAGQAEVFFTDFNNQLWLDKDTGGLVNTGGFATSLSVGTTALGADDLWFLDGNNQVHRYSAGTFLATGAYGQELAAGSHGLVYFRDGADQLWTAADDGTLTNTHGYATSLAANQDASHHHDEVYFLDGESNLWQYDQGDFVNSHDYALALTPYAWRRVV